MKENLCVQALLVRSPKKETKMNRCAYEQNAMAGCEGMKMVDSVVCPKPRRLNLINPSLNDSIRPFRYFKYVPFSHTLFFFIFFIYNHVVQILIYQSQRLFFRAHGFRSYFFTANRKSEILKQGLNFWIFFSPRFLSLIMKRLF